MEPNAKQDHSATDKKGETSMMRRIWRVTFKSSSETNVDVEAANIIEASNIATVFLQVRRYNYDGSSIIRAEIIAEPITLPEKGNVQHE